ncbi:MAG: 4-(cytidine 5'-diphospho)-2-C-methyl-D-erythritol kinase [Candidatus Omnitrophica bacterium]|nr:4-(cytidine 5'-diphospho)-2-C-methyl-D-erythritol kinase [Candidatus Omnitrophota bacterium]MCG2702824.1 4-(cytidine 5'-diphospho)-2-C-methyl-D-erythritol kinase [Candidatus Omnitrophota bacterium]
MYKSVLTLKAPAKINLFLEVLGKRKDGHHNLITLFLKINLFDRLYFKDNAEKEITILCTDKRVPDNSDNLVYKAAELLRKKTGCKRGAHIRIIKKIPIGAGLGGGSSDAAAALSGLNLLWKLKLTHNELLSLGRKIGADVPFFILPDSAAIGRGRGDILKPVYVKKPLWLVVVDPGIFVSTKEVYSALALSLTKRKKDVKILTYALKNCDIKTMANIMFNRLESVTFKKYSKLAQIKKRISALGVRAVLMSGSGSSIFGIVDKREEAIRIKNELHGAYNVMVGRSL